MRLDGEERVTREFLRVPHGWLGNCIFVSMSVRIAEKGVTPTPEPMMRARSYS